jgi:hypothetical protein
MNDTPPNWASGLWRDIGAPVVLLVVGGIGSAVVAWMRGIARRRRVRAEVEAVTADAARKCLDGVRQALWMLHRPELAEDDEMQARLAVTRHEIDEVRERLWLAMGHPRRER